MGLSAREDAARPGTRATLLPSRDQRLTQPRRAVSRRRGRGSPQRTRIGLAPSQNGEFDSIADVNSEERRILLSPRSRQVAPRPIDRHRESRARWRLDRHELARNHGRRRPQRLYGSRASHVGVVHAPATVVRGELYCVSIRTGHKNALQSTTTTHLTSNQILRCNNRLEFPLWCSDRKPPPLLGSQR